MYSFAQRADTRVVDEPLYGHYLRVSGADHPAAREVMRAMNCDGDAVMAALLRADDRPCVFAKQMAHHLREIDESFLAQTVNVLLIRDPHDMLPSLTVQLPHAALADTGYAQQVRIAAAVTALGQPLLVLDARELLANPAGVLTVLLQQLGLEFDPAMLQWSAGSRPEDGVWAPHWYHNVHRSTGFGAYHARDEFPPALQALLEECRPHYETLRAHAITAPAN